jgi:hypothetical protein
MPFAFRQPVNLLQNTAQPVRVIDGIIDTLLMRNQ